MFFPYISKHLWTQNLLGSNTYQVTEYMRCHKQAPGVLDWNVSNRPQRWRPILPLDWKQSSRELMMVKWGQTTETSTEGGRQVKEGGKGCREANVITLSLVHCCLLNDLIWSRRHTWGKAHPSQVLQNSSLVLVPLFILPFSPFSLIPTSPSFQGSLSPSPPICPALPVCVTIFDSSLSILKLYTALSITKVPEEHM